MSLLLVFVAAFAVPALLARFLATRTRVPAMCAASVFPGVLLLWGAAERAGLIATGQLIDSNTGFGRAEQWTYLAGGCGVLFAVGLVVASLSVRIARRR